MLVRFIPIILIFCLFGCDRSPSPSNTITHSGLGLGSAALSEDGSSALVATIDLGVQYWDLPNNKLNFKINHHNDEPIIALDIALQTPIGVSLSSDSLAVWDLNDGTAYRFLSLDSTPTTVKISKTGKYALVGFVNNRAKLIDLTKGKVLRTFEHADIVNAVALSPKQDLAVIGSDDTAVRVWDLNSGEMKHQWFHPAKVTHLNTSPDNRYLLSHSAQHKTWIHDLQSGLLVSEINIKPKSFFRSLAPSVTTSLFSKNSQLVFTGHPPNLIKVWEVRTGILKKTIQLPKRSVWQPSATLPLDMAFNEDESTLTIETSNGQAYQYPMSQLQ